MPAPQTAPELRLVSDAERILLEEPRPPSERLQWALRGWLAGGPLLLVLLWSGIGARAGCLTEVLSSLLFLAVALGWIGVLAGDRYLRELEIARGTARLRARGSSYGGLLPRQLELERASLSTLRLESLLADESDVRWSEVRRLVAVLRRGSAAAAESPRPWSRRLLVGTPVLRLAIQAADGRRWRFVFRVEGIADNASIAAWFAAMAEMLGLGEPRVEWSDQRKVIVSAGREPARVAERFVLPGAGNAAAGRPAGEPAAIAVGLSLAGYRVDVWEPASRIVVTRRWNRSVTGSCMTAVAVLLAMPLLAWAAGQMWSDFPAGAGAQAWRAAGLLLALGALPGAVALWLARPRRWELDWRRGTARVQGIARRRQLALSSVAAVRLREDTPSRPSEVGDPYTFTIELVARQPAGEEPLVLVVARATNDRGREATHRRLAPFAAALAESLQVPYLAPATGQAADGAVSPHF